METQGWDTFEERHDDNVAVFWLGQLEPTKGLHNHREESVGFFRTFLDNHLVKIHTSYFFKDNYAC